ncbi:ion transporter [Salinisphaera sp. Q1T1-3]|uniref:ion transporter n=1 Tax=Salinisphaera sp. Q1T1-3 TaxID=2321229 RepID=UPI000E73A66B|nr:ion transporter [Salinisphaera sp. Q1T1-3]RJS92886.1 ion transporter [Salinisphaera sp. Q1T1-3]
MSELDDHHTTLRERLRTIIFGTSTRAGWLFDVVLLLVIVASVANLMLISVAGIRARIGDWLDTAEWVFTVVFTIEYLTRIAVARRPMAYIRSFYGLVDLVSILPMYVAIFIPASHFFIAIRVLRVARMFRVLKLGHYDSDLQMLRRSLMEAQRKLQIFMGMLALFVTVLGAIMYVVEGPEHGFTSIPRAIYWGVVTITTVGYGDISPATPLGQAIAGVAILIGYAVLAVTTGIITATLTNELRNDRQGIFCPHCERSGHEKDASYCRFCGGDLDEDPEDEEVENEEQAEAREKLD